LYGPVTRHHEVWSGGYVVEKGRVSVLLYASCAAEDFPKGDDGRHPGVDHDPCSGRLSLFFSQCSFLEMLVWETYPVISS